MKKRFALLLAAAILISGCAKPADNSDGTDSAARTTETAPTLETREETREETSQGGVPAITLKPSVPENPVAQGGGVVLSEDRFAEFKELTDFRGEYTTLEDSGLEYKFVAESELNGGEPAFELNAWDGKLYFRKGKVFTDAADGETPALYYTKEENAVIELDIESGETREIPIPEYNGELKYADGEYMAFQRNKIMEGEFGGETYQYPVCSGIAFYIIDEDRFFEIDAEELFRVYRVGRSFYYKTTVHAQAQGEREIDIPAVGRARPSLSLNEIVLEFASPEGSLADGIFCSEMGGIAYYDALSGRQSEYVGVSIQDEIYESDFLCYIQQRGKDNIFGERFAAGYYPHPQVQKQVILTNYGVRLYSVCVSRSGMFYASLGYTKGEDKNRGILFDTANNRAVVMPENTSSCRMSGDWMVFDYYTEDYSEHGYLAVNTARED